MARGFTTRGRGKGFRYSARLEQHERDVVVELMSQVLVLIGGPAEARETHEDADGFDAIVAGLGPSFGATPDPSRTGAADGELGDRGFGAAERDSALDRLFPAGNRKDERAATEFREMTEVSLRRRKAENLQTAIAVLTHGPDERVELRADDALAFVVALTDVRLVLGDRLGLREDADAERLEAILEMAEPDDPAAYAVALYDFLTWLQETLATAMLSRAGR